MKRVRLVVSYDGTNYCGWQSQNNGVAVQDVLNRHLSELLGEPIETIGASRTDAGVHAFGNVAVFDTKHRMPAEKISFALNTRLPEDIRIQKSEEVAADFHPRYCSSVKTYEYKILNRQIPVPTLRHYAHFTYVPLDVELMKMGARYLIGEHDFKSFCGAGAQVKTTVREVLEIEFSQEPLGMLNLWDEDQKGCTVALCGNVNERELCRGNVSQQNVLQQNASYPNIPQQNIVQQNICSKSAENCEYMGNDRIQEEDKLHGYDGKQGLSVGTSRTDDLSKRTLQEKDLQSGEIITMRIRGKGFLYNMVRIIAGTLMEVGRGKYSPEYVAEILSACDREAAGPTAPARGLTLVEIQYQND